MKYRPSNGRCLRRFHRWKYNLERTRRVSGRCLRLHEAFLRFRYCWSHQEGEMIHRVVIDDCIQPMRSRIRPSITEHPQLRSKLFIKRFAREKYSKNVAWNVLVEPKIKPGISWIVFVHPRYRTPYFPLASLAAALIFRISETGIQWMLSSIPRNGRCLPGTSTNRTILSGHYLSRLIGGSAFFLVIDI